MNKVFFILTHIGSDESALREAFVHVNPYINIFNTGFQYQTYEDLVYLRSLPHSNKTMAAIWSDTLNQNQSLSRFLLPYVDVIGYVSFTQECENQLLERYGRRYLDYYQNRLMGISQFMDRKGSSVIAEPGKISVKLLKHVKFYFPSLVLS